MTITGFFKQPYPFYDTLAQRWRLVITISLFIGVFCVVFLPFQLDELPRFNKYLTAFGFGGMTFLALVLNMILLPSWLPTILKESGWTVAKELVWVLWMLLCISITCSFYAIYFYEVEPTLGFFLWVFGASCLVGVMPAIGVIFFKQIYLYERVMKEVGIMNTSLQSQRVGAVENLEFSLQSENGKDELRLSHQQLLYLESAGNYVEVHYLQHGTLKKHLLRNKISTLADELSHNPMIFRCHRSILVNLEQVTALQGNSQGYRLVLGEGGVILPVARSNSKLIRERLQKVLTP